MAVPSSVRLVAAGYQISREVPVSRVMPLDVLPSGIAVRFTKRAIDVLIAVVGLILGAPIFALIALAVRVDSKGPIFYRQWRASMLEARRANGELHFSRFEMIKFRSMRVDAEKATGAVLAEENDPRITRVGRFLRKTRLDELPQLWNVLSGDMSVVGPRPERPELLENLAVAIPFFEERLRGTKPGITGLAQVSLTYTGRPPEGSEIAELGETIVNPYRFEEAEGSLADDMRTKLLFDLAYVAALEHFTTYVVMEMGILLKTPWIMVRGVGR
jgi:lipopolysaccharide/colanic/teichoic acid biosynthesis glycosyltransferase